MGQSGRDFGRRLSEMHGPERCWAVDKESKSGGGPSRTQRLIRPQAKLRGKIAVKPS